MLRSRMLVRPFHQHSVITLICHDGKNSFFLPAGCDIVLNNSTTALTPLIGLPSRRLLPSRLKDPPEELFLSVANCDLAKSLFVLFFFAFWALCLPVRG